MINSKEDLQKSINKNKIIVSDLDGTLLRSDKTISKYSVSILEKCKNIKLPVWYDEKDEAIAYKYIEAFKKVINNIHELI
ncbi:MAG: HAD hydrolase family protein [Defluviitaleaceae bacterium]|nr:HAD hydrolase family protein [Defluviitaleaceae bacterium]